MKQLTVILFAAAALLQTTSCKKTDSGKVYRGRIINSICASTTVQFIDGTELGQNNWVDAFNTDKPKYNHVFKVANPCNAGLGTHHATDTIEFVLTTPTSQECMQCMALGCTPEVAMHIKVVK
jgi:hypothetical protein